MRYTEIQKLPSDLAMRKSRSRAMLGGEDVIQSKLARRPQSWLRLDRAGGFTESVPGRRENRGLKCPIS